MFIHSIKLNNILSFGPNSGKIILQPLNVIIGRNGSGKSNFIEAIDLLQATPKDFTVPIRSGGGINEWLWKGEAESKIATIEVEVEDENLKQRFAQVEDLFLRHRIEFTADKQGRIELVDEVIENNKPTPKYVEQKNQDTYFYYRYQRGNPVINTFAETTAANGHKATLNIRSLRRESLKPDQSVLSQRRDPDLYPELNSLAEKYEALKLYREWQFGRNSQVRTQQRSDLPRNFVLESGSNLGLVMSYFKTRPSLKRELLDRLRDFNLSYVDIDFIPSESGGGSLDIYLQEEGRNDPIPLTRLSDGTIRYLFLLAILCHPTPPPLVCIEEPELGMHPDVIPELARLLKDLSTRTQVIVTTHSDILVSAMNSNPAAILVCENNKNGTTLKRLDPEELKTWLDTYSLGELWLRGELGGVA